MSGLLRQAPEMAGFSAVVRCVDSLLLSGQKRSPATPEEAVEIYLLEGPPADNGAAGG